MEISCPSCRKGFSIPDEKIPRDRAISMACPSCRGKIQIDLRTGPLEEGAEGSLPPSFYSLEEEMESMAEKSHRALLCLTNEDHLEAFRTLLEVQGYLVRISQTIEEALERIRFTNYRIVVLHEEFGGVNLGNNAIYLRMKSMPMETRRGIFFAIVGKKFKAHNPMMAFIHSANLLVNEKDIPRIDRFLLQAMAENDRFYHVYREVRRELEK